MKPYIPRWREPEDVARMIIDGLNKTRIDAPNLWYSRKKAENGDIIITVVIKQEGKEESKFI